MRTGYTVSTSTAAPTTQTTLLLFSSSRESISHALTNEPERYITWRLWIVRWKPSYALYLGRSHQVALPYSVEAWSHHGNRPTWTQKVMVPTPILPFSSLLDSLMLTYLSDTWLCPSTRNSPSRLKVQVSEHLPSIHSLEIAKVEYRGWFLH